MLLLNVAALCLALLSLAAAPASAQGDVCLETLRAARSCSVARDCVTAVKGTSCGCTRDHVINSRYSAEAYLAAYSKCGLGGSVGICDCPPANGFACVSGTCTWNYANASPSSPSSSSSSSPAPTTSTSAPGTSLPLGFEQCVACKQMCAPEQGPFVQCLKRDGSIESSTFGCCCCSGEVAVQKIPECANTVCKPEPTCQPSERLVKRRGLCCTEYTCAPASASSTTTASTTPAPTRSSPTSDENSCGGFANIPCAPGYTCVDDPADSCDPKQGGADCPGICMMGDPVVLPPPGCLVWSDGCNSCTTFKNNVVCTQLECFAKDETVCVKPDLCFKNECRADEICVPDPKQCFTTPCPQYACLPVDPTPTPSDTPNPVECEPLACRLACPYGLATDPATGCSICKCASFHPHCTSISDDCNTCEVKNGAVLACTNNICVRAGPFKCVEYTCPEVMCDLFCENGFATDPESMCNICSCSEVSTSPELTKTSPGGCSSDEQCPDGHFCQTCYDSKPVGECHPYSGLGETCSGFRICPGKCSPSFTCTQRHQSPYLPQIMDMPGICCPPLKCESSCGENSVPVTDKNGCPTCECKPLPCGPAGAEMFSQCDPSEFPSTTCKSQLCVGVEDLFNNVVGVCCAPEVVECGKPCQIYGCAAPPPGCEYQGPVPVDECGCAIGCGTLVCGPNVGGIDCSLVKCGRPTCSPGEITRATPVEGECCPNVDCVPDKTCSVWFDGCNTCKVDNGKILGCTKMMCLRAEPTKCLEFVDTTSTSPAPSSSSSSSSSDIPLDCRIWFDGCNNCKVENGEMIACTERMCLRVEPTKCIEYVDAKTTSTSTSPAPSSSDIPLDCLVWNDGCNECVVDMGKILGCTKRMCLVQGKPYCVSYACPEVMCTLFCENGFAKDSRGCNTCSCAGGEPPQPQVPEGCLVWFDGCNSCTIIDGKVAACTAMACEQRLEPECRVFASDASPSGSSSPTPEITTPPGPSTTPRTTSSFVADCVVDPKGNYIPDGMGLCTCARSPNFARSLNAVWAANVCKTCSFIDENTRALLCGTTSTSTSSSTSPTTSTSATTVPASTSRSVDLSDTRICKSGLIEGTTTKCTCGDTVNCFMCTVGNPDVCLRCRNARLNYNGVCIALSECPANMAAVGSGNFGWECRTPHTCVGGKDPRGNACSCAVVSSCLDCNVSAGTNAVTCTKCDVDRYTVNGKCPRQATCKSFKITGSPVDEKCTCKNADCLECNVDRTGLIQCITCRNGKFMHNGVCISACPDGYVEVKKGSSLFGRTCELSFTCAKGKVTTLGHPRYGRTCQCPDSDCYICNLSEDATVCTRCKNGRYLHEGACLDACPTSHTHDGVGAYGRECSVPYTCNNGRSSLDGAPCACSDPNCLNCDWLAGNSVRSSVCKTCKNSNYLLDGKCLRTCPVGTTPIGADAVDRVCK